MMDLIIVGATTAFDVIKAVVPWILLVFGWIVNEALKRSQLRRDKRAQCYEATILAIDKLWARVYSDDFEDLYRETSDRITPLVLWSTKHAYKQAIATLKCITEVNRSTKDTEEALFEEYRAAYNSMLKAMRRDIYIREDLPDIEFRD